MKNLYVWIAALMLLFVLLGFVYQGLGPVIQKFIFGLPNQEAEHVVIDMSSTEHKAGDFCSVIVGAIAEPSENSLGILNSYENHDFRSLLVNRQGKYYAVEDITFTDRGGLKQLEFFGTGNPLPGWFESPIIGKFIEGAETRLIINPLAFFSNSVLSKMTFEELLQFDGSELTQGNQLCKYPSASAHPLKDMIGLVNQENYNQIFVKINNQYQSTGYTLLDLDKTGFKLYKIDGDNRELYGYVDKKTNRIIILKKDKVAAMIAETPSYYFWINNRLVKQVDFESKQNVFEKYSITGLFL